MSYCRTPEHRQRRSEMIHRWKPWERSTGPRTPQGKARASMNRWRGGQREALRALTREFDELLEQQASTLEELRVEFDRPRCVQP